MSSLPRVLMTPALSSTPAHASTVFKRSRSPFNNEDSSYKRAKCDREPFGYSSAANSDPSVVPSSQSPELIPYQLRVDSPSTKPLPFRNSKEPAEYESQTQDDSQDIYGQFEAKARLRRESRDTALVAPQATALHHENGYTTLVESEVKTPPKPFILKSSLEDAMNDVKCKSSLYNFCEPDKITGFAEVPYPLHISRPGPLSSTHEYVAENIQLCEYLFAERQKSETLSVNLKAASEAINAATARIHQLEEIVSVVEEKHRMVFEENYGLRRRLKVLEKRVKRATRELLDFGDSEASNDTD
ncbi:hypothetical protein VKT23_012901 [Stygiomarasmius scandens]|uniref:Uncharacterized protein n=1 Tax=Marasmiellus scandens TaxID=2682957 RepID=A0ABR1J5X8_9AGAR